ncbi:TOM13-domain-containing protein [Lophiostoma macrostomum CBS 122681]|uniref:TOM13-domain-containing protein n=1 Tax=Lophiostoma macrostomum CBS 122681 TaxID=1314788 RepID=A0A6A6SXR9_9PLEO|nr:TOM13-domain-containing protein [Lophiostoma macrostomum CBS 122681]
MASSSSPQSAPRNLTESGITIPSDSENYDANNELSPSPPSSSSTPLILYKPPTIWGLIRGAAINLLLPFINGLMLGFGELVANEAAFRLGWSGTKDPLLALYYFPTASPLIPNMPCSPASVTARLPIPILTLPSQIFPTHRSDTRRVGPGVEMRADPVERRRRDGRELDMYTSLE